MSIACFSASMRPWILGASPRLAPSPTACGFPACSAAACVRPSGASCSCGPVLSLASSARSSHTSLKEHAAITPCHPLFIGGMKGRCGSLFSKIKMPQSYSTCCKNRRSCTDRSPKYLRGLPHIQQLHTVEVLNALPRCLHERVWPHHL